MIIFPVITFIFLWVGCRRIFGQSMDWRESFLGAATLWGLLLVLATEFFSSIHALAYPYLLTFWIFTSLATSFFVKQVDIGGFTREVFNFFTKITLFDRVLIAGIALALGLMALTAWMAPPNTWDSLVYHMSRVMHWQQNQSIEHYPTNIKTQIYFPPFAEWVILHLQILWGNDQWANFVQWFSLLGSVIAVSLVARLLGASGSGQLLATFFLITMPMVILQASSTQNDGVLTFWIVNFVYWGLLWQKNRHLHEVVFAAGAMSLAILTKGLAYVLLAPFLLWLLIQGIWKIRTKIMVPVVVTLLLVIAVNFNHAYRNYHLTGQVLGEHWVSAMTRNERMSFGYFISNIVRNLGLHLATSSKPLNTAVERSIYKIHDTLRVSIIDPVTTFLEYPFHVSVSTHEDTAGQFCQLLLLFVASGFFMFERKKNPAMISYFCLWVGVVVLFNLLIRWQPSGSRLHLPIFVLAIPFAAVVLNRRWSTQKPVLMIVVLILAMTSVPYLFRNSTRKLISSKSTVFSLPRWNQYFADDPRLRKPYESAAQFVVNANCHDLGLRLGDNAWEYPFWVGLKQFNTYNLRIEHVDVDGLSVKNYPLGGFTPCAIIETSRTNAHGEQLILNQKVYVRKFEAHPVRVYVPINVYE